MASRSAEVCWLTGWQSVDVKKKKTENVGFNSPTTATTGTNVKSDPRQRWVIRETNGERCCLFGCLCGFRYATFLIPFSTCFPCGFHLSLVLFLHVIYFRFDCTERRASNYRQTGYSFEPSSPS